MLSHHRHHEGRRAGTAVALSSLFTALLASSALLFVLGVAATQQRSRAAAATVLPPPPPPPLSSTPPSPRSRRRQLRRPRTGPAHAATTTTAAAAAKDDLGDAALRLARLRARAARRHPMRGGLPAACFEPDDGARAAAAAADCGTTDTPRAAAVVAAMRHAWGAYARHAWGHDELRPRAAAAAAAAAAEAAGSKRKSEEAEAGTETEGNYRDWSPGVRLAVTLVDSLDTLYLMGLRAEFEEAAAWVAEDGTGAAWAPRGDSGGDVDGYLSVFETTIRAVGGLLSAYCLSHRPALLRAAVAVADLLLPAFAQEHTGIPSSLYNPRTNASRAHAWAPGGGRAVLAEVGSVQLELRWLTWLTGDTRYDRAGTRAFAAAFLTGGGGGGGGSAEERAGGLYPLYLSPRTAEFVSSAYSVGTLGDSFYEYLLKQHLAAGGGGGGSAAPPRGYGVYGEMWEAAVAGVRRLLAGREGRYAFVGPRRGGVLARRMDHLSCFFPGAVMLGLGSRWGWRGVEGVASAADRSLLAWAEGLLETCVAMYDESPVGLAAEQVVFARGTMRPSEGSGGYRLRPETAESLFYAHRLTGKLRYREAGWRIFTAIEQHCRVPEGGYVGVSARQGGGGGPDREGEERGAEGDDVMESFFTAETLKYLFLLFADPVVLPLDRFVFNTEAHPLPIATAPPPSRAALWSLKEAE